MKKFTKILSLVLCLIMTLSVLISCADDQTVAPSTNADDMKAQMLAGDFYDENGLYFAVTGENVCEVSIGKAAALETVVIPAVYQGYTVTSIARSGFADCQNLKSITIPETVVTIEDRAFYGSANLAEIKIADNSLLKKIGSSVFKNTAYYGNINNWQESVLYVGTCLVEADKNITACNIKDGTTAIAGSAFYDCTNLASITIPNSLQYIDSFAFKNCSSLKSVNISSMKTWCSIEFADYSVNPLSTGVCGLYLNGGKVTSITFTNDITSIGNYAFYGYKDLKDVVVSLSIQSIGNKAFHNVVLTAERDSETKVITKYHCIYEGSEDEWKAISKAGASLPANGEINFLG